MPALSATLEALIFGRNRTIGGIIPDVVISENHVDEVEVTDHPVDAGAQITDHAFKKPATINCQFGWSDSSRLVNSVLDGSIFKGITSINEVYSKLLEMQSKRETFELSTAKRTYGEVIITKLETTTTADTENALIIDISFREIIRVSTKTTTLAAIVQKDPKSTASVKNQGTKYALSTAGR